MQILTREGLGQKLAFCISSQLPAGAESTGLQTTSSAANLRGRFAQSCLRSTSWTLVRNTDSQAPAQTHYISISGEGQETAFNEPILIFVQESALCDIHGLP